jgi:diacylglycerol kinase (ATP)
VPRVLVLTNPLARRAALAPQVARTLERNGWTVEAVSATDPGGLEEHARRAVREGVDLVVALGGDGTVTHVASALAGSGVPLGIVPGGTGNLLAGNLGIPGRPDAAMRVLLSGVPRRIDLGRAESGGRARHFVVACGVGFDARVMAAARPGAKRHLGKLAYMATAVALTPRIRNVPVRLTIDGVLRETEAAEIFVANVGSMTAWLRPRRPIAPDDGFLDVIVVRASGPLGGALAAWEAIRFSDAGDHPGGRISRALGREIRIEATPPLPMELDGDVGGSTPLVATVEAGAISVLVPDRSVLRR